MNGPGQSADAIIENRKNIRMFNSRLTRSLLLAALNVPRLGQGQIPRLALIEPLDWDATTREYPAKAGDTHALITP